MSCETCNKLLSEIQEIDLIVKDSTNDYNYWENRLNYLVFTSVDNRTLEIVREFLAQSEKTLMKVKDKQRKKHNKLSKHYRESHLHGYI